MVKLPGYPRNLRELHIENSVVRGEDVRLAPALRTLSVTGCELVRWQNAHAALAACTNLRRLSISGRYRRLGFALEVS